MSLRMVGFAAGARVDGWFGGSWLWIIAPRLVATPAFRIDSGTAGIMNANSRNIQLGVYVRWKMALSDRGLSFL